MKLLEDYWGKVLYENPNKELHKWEGTLYSNGKEIKGSIDNLLLRGCTLRNTFKAFGVVLYIGKHTKIVMNSRTVWDKLSNVIITMNRILLSVFLLQLVLMTVFASSAIAWKWTHKNHIYVKESWDDDLNVRWYDWFINFLLYISDYALMVPIAIYPMVEVLKLVLSNWIWSDDSMKDEKGGCDVWNSNILEELG